MGAEIGALGIKVLAGIKNTLDPEGIMNPGKLIPRTTAPPVTTSPTTKETP